MEKNQAGKGDGTFWRGGQGAELLGKMVKGYLTEGLRGGATSPRKRVA